MYKPFVSLLFILFFTQSYSQVGVGTTSPNGALDITSSNDGILVPRVALSATDIPTVITPTVSELVYNTFTSDAGPNQVTPGYYYWDGSAWNRLATVSSSPSEWSLLGNAGTNPATNYIGTSDANDLVLRTDAVDRVHIDVSGNVGINEVAPGSKLDLVQLDDSGNSIEVTHNNAANASSSVFIKNSGIGRALYALNIPTTSNKEVARFLQYGAGIDAHGVKIDMFSTTSAGSSGLFVNNQGAGYGAYITMPAGNASAGIVSDHSGSGAGLEIYQRGSGLGINNDVEDGIGVYNIIRSNSYGTVNLLTTAGGTGGYVDLGIQDGIGYRAVAVDNFNAPTAGGDVFGFYADMRTQTPTTVSSISGAAFVGLQSGVGHGILMNHSGSQGKNAEFNISNASNTDAVITSFHQGQGSAIVGENLNNDISGTISVADFRYTGTDVADHTGVFGSSQPAASWGIGVQGNGNWYGVFAGGNLGASGTKTFLADYPLDPANKFLRHFAVESDEILNMYRGMVELDASGQAVIELPDYFELVNQNFSYQLTAIGTPQQPYVLTEIKDNKFTVAGAANTKVSWMVISERNDAYILANPDSKGAVVNKIGERKGKYVTPEYYGLPASSGLFYKDKEATIPATNIQLSKNALENISNIEKKTPIRPKTNSNGLRD